MKSSMRDAKFIPERINIEPEVPEPKIDWIKEKKLDVSYGNDPLQKFDIYYPLERKESYPVLILVHGGGFIMCDKRDWHVYPGFYALDRGFVLVSVNYRLSPKDPYPAAVDDMKSAILYLRKHAGELKIDANNFFLYGTSAGGNLVTDAGLHGADSVSTDDDYHVNAVAALCGAINFADYFSNEQRTVMSQLPSVDKAFSEYAGVPIVKVSPKEIEANADRYIPKNPPAFYIQHGEDDDAVHVKQSINFYELLKKTCNLTKDDLMLDIMTGTRHAGDGPEYLERENVDPIIDFFKNHMV